MWGTTSVNQLRSTKPSGVKSRSAISTFILSLRFRMKKINERLHELEARWNGFCGKAGICEKCSNHTVHIALLMLLPFSATASAETGIATWYSIASVKAEGNSGITASGEKFNEALHSCAMRSRNFGKRYRVTNLKTGEEIVCRHNDYGPGKAQAKRGILIDLTPAAFDELGCKRGVTKTGIAWGECLVEVLEVQP